MKLIRILSLCVASITLSLTAVSCSEEKGPGEKIGSKIDDALDQRPGEKVRDAVEDIVE